VWVWCANALGNCWREPQSCPHPATTALELSLRPSPRLRGVLWLLRLLILAYAGELVLAQHGTAASLVLMLAVAGLWRARAPRGRGLRLEADGRLFLRLDDDSTRQVWLAGSGLRLGSHLLLVLRSGKSCHRVLLGPDNLAAGELAALQRRLPITAAAGATALHSVAAPGSKSSVAS
jgi:hypothetical protein